LRIPDDITARATTVSWKAGKLHALRPVFRELGHTAAFVYAVNRIRSTGC